MIRASLTQALTSLENPKLLPQSVYEEMLVGEAHGKPEAGVLQELVEEGAITVTRPRNIPLEKRLIKIAVEAENMPLHRAEAEAIAIAKEMDAVLIADDHAARTTAKLVQVECHGTGYMLGTMYQERQISKEVAMKKVTEIRKAGWRLSEDDYRITLDYLETLQSV